MKNFPSYMIFFGAYFHQDWTVEHEDAGQVIDAFLTESDPQALVNVQKELCRLIAKKKSELALREYLLKELICYYCYWNTWESGESWLLHIVRKLSDRLNCTS
ncbi:contact-dependent growth inhibition system immunity protein [Pseudomonas sp. NFX224]|uniref:contact-dependent growth inhibition system immunity protein n=1 Tax=Pseudomonas sp. NFX224 TaxID=3402862 RepID=UPI003AFA75FA